MRLSAVCYMLVISIEPTISLILVISCYFWNLLRSIHSIPRSDFPLYIFYLTRLSTLYAANPAITHHGNRMSKLITAVYEVNRQDKTPPSPHTHMHSTHAQLPPGTNSCSFILLRPIVPMESEAFISRPEVDSPLAKQFCCCMGVCS